MKTDDIRDLIRAVELSHMGWHEVMFWWPKGDDYITRAQLWCWTEIEDDTWEHLAGRFYFKNAEDAMLFKLRWA
mgnify:CR=1 FL=1